MKRRNESLYWAMRNISAGSPRWLNRTIFLLMYAVAVVVTSALAVNLGEFIRDNLL